MNARLIRHFDYGLLLTTFVLIVLGILMISSATTNTPDLQDYPVRQAIYALGGCVLLVLGAMADYRGLAALRWPLYLGLLISLAVIFVLGQVLHGGQRWFDLGLFTVQPSELAKPLFVIVLASYLSARQEQIRSFSTLVGSLVLLAAPVLLIYLQPDLGTALVLVFVWAVMVFVAGVPHAFLVGLGAMGIASLPLVWTKMEGYMQGRLLVFLNPEGNPAARYNIDQALISIGSGGIFGKGFRLGSQSQLHFLRIRHTDYIFSVIGEELGLAGCLLVIGLLGLMVWRMLRTAEIARDGLGRLVAVGMASILFFQSGVNMAVNVGLLPVTGIPLPFISFGGSSLLTLMLIVGLVEGITMRRKKIDF